MKILTSWLRSFLPALSVDDQQLAEDLTLRGIAVEGVSELAKGDGALFDMDITTNRVDAMNHYGVAREVAAIYDLGLAPLVTELPPDGAGEGYPVRIEAEAQCGRFTARVIRGVSIAPSVNPVAGYFEALGQKQISNAVDATNFVLLGMGHPTHAFDLDKIEGAITVRMARAGEELHLLDGTTRTLVAEDLVIADEKKAISLAGVMGGYDTMITADTKNVLVEAAWFDPATVRATSRRHLIHTDASHRFERGADFAAAPVANALVCRQILASAGGMLAGPMTDVVVQAHAAATLDRAPIELKVSHVQKLLGRTVAPEGITAGVIERYLAALGCVLEARDGDTYVAKLPSWRLDLAREVDLTEEVARVYGYNRFSNTLPMPGIVHAHPADEPLRLIRARLLALGYTEALSSSFASAADLAYFGPGGEAVALENPLSEESSHLRSTLMPGMVTMLAQNLTRDVLLPRLFELGACFQGSAERVNETPALALGLTGEFTSSAPVHVAADAPFYELKGALESVFSLFEIVAPAVTTQALPPMWEPGRAAAFTLEGQPVAWFGQLSATEAARRKLRQPLYLAEVRLDLLLGCPLRRTMARELSRFQAVDRDFSFIFRDAVRWADIEGAIRALGIAELQRIQPIEVFRDARKFPGVHSTLTRVTFQSGDRTLTEEDLTAWWAAIIAALQALGGTLRDS